MQRMIAIDYGERRIGVAASEGRLALPLTIVEHESRAADLDRIVAIAREREATAVVVGLPVGVSGEEHEQARRARRFGDALARRLTVPVVYQDELLSTKDARAAARVAAPTRRVRHVDDRAAAVILQAYLDEMEPPP